MYTYVFGQKCRQLQFPDDGWGVGVDFSEPSPQSGGGRSLPVFRLSSLVLNKTPPSGEIDERKRRSHAVSERLWVRSAVRLGGERMRK